MAIKKTYKFCYVVNRVNRIWPTYAITLGSRQHISVGRRKENCQGDQQSCEPIDWAITGSDVIPISTMTSYLHQR